jgi:hypothetical protein
VALLPEKKIPPLRIVRTCPSPMFEVPPVERKELIDAGVDSAANPPMLTLAVLPAVIDVANSVATSSALIPFGV